MLRTRHFAVVLLLIVSLVLGLTVSAQQVTPGSTEPPDPNANISWPPPVYVLRGEFTVRGSANLANMTSYFIEIRRLNNDASVPNPDAAWTPAVLPNAAAVRDDVLGIWNTLLVQDGLYEMRLSINLSAGNPVHFVVSPLRVENVPPPFAITPTAPAISQPTITPLATQPQVQVQPTLPPTPTALDLTPRATAISDANVRKGDGTNYEVVGSLLQGQSAVITGLSSFGSGWYQIRLSNGALGWVAPSVVNVTGDLRSVPRVDPPAPPTPTPTPTPITQVDLVAGNIDLNPDTPRCAQTFNIFIDVANFGTTANLTGGTISVTDTHVNSGSVQGTTVGAFGIIQPGQTVRVGPIPLTVSTFFAEEHRLTLVVDSTGVVPETNEGNNTSTLGYTLLKASC